MRSCDGEKERRASKKENQRPTLKNRGWGTLRVAASRSDIAVCARGSIFQKERTLKVVRATRPSKKENPRPTLKNRGWGTLRVAASRSDIAVCARGSIFLKGKKPSNRRGHPPRRFTAVTEGEKRIGYHHHLDATEIT